LEGIIIPSKIQVYKTHGEKNIITGNREEIDIPNPRILFPRELAKLKQECIDGGVSYYNKLRRYGISLYTFSNRNEEIPKEEEIPIQQIVYEFENELDNWEFLNWERRILNVPAALLFLNKNISSLIVYDNLNVDEEKTFINSLINYQKRIGGEFYWGNEDSDWSESIEVYKNLDIPKKESGRYFREALKFQKETKMYELRTEDELGGFMRNQFELPLDIIEKYSNNEKLNREQIEKISEFYKSVGKKLFFTLQFGGALGEDISYALNELKKDF